MVFSAAFTAFGVVLATTAAEEWQLILGTVVCVEELARVIAAAADGDLRAR